MDAVEVATNNAEEAHLEEATADVEAASADVESAAKATVEKATSTEVKSKEDSASIGTDKKLIFEEWETLNPTPLSSSNVVASGGVTGWGTTSDVKAPTTSSVTTPVGNGWDAEGETPVVIPTLPTPIPLSSSNVSSSGGWANVVKKQPAPKKTWGGANNINNNNTALSTLSTSVSISSIPTIPAPTPISNNSSYIVSNHTSLQPVQTTITITPPRSPVKEVVTEVKPNIVSETSFPKSPIIVQDVPVVIKPTAGGNFWGGGGLSLSQRIQQGV